MDNLKHSTLTQAQVNLSEPKLEPTLHTRAHLINVHPHLIEEISSFVDRNRSLDQLFKLRPTSPYELQAKLTKLNNALSLLVFILREQHLSETNPNYFNSRSLYLFPTPSSVIYYLQCLDLQPQILRALVKISAAEARHELDLFNSPDHHNRSMIQQLINFSPAREICTYSLLKRFRVDNQLELPNKIHQQIIGMFQAISKAAATRDATTRLEKYQNVITTKNRKQIAQTNLGEFLNFLSSVQVDKIWNLVGTFKQSRSGIIPAAKVIQGRNLLNLEKLIAEYYYTSTSPAFKARISLAEVVDNFDCIMRNSIQKWNVLKLGKRKLTDSIVKLYYTHPHSNNLSANHQLFSGLNYLRNHLPVSEEIFLQNLAGYGPVYNYANFNGKDLTRTNLRNLQLNSANFTNTKLQGADFYNSKLTNAKFDHAILGEHPAILSVEPFYQVSVATSFIRADLTNATFHHTQIPSNHLLRTDNTTRGIDSITNQQIVHAMRYKPLSNAMITKFSYPLHKVINKLKQNQINLENVIEPITHDNLNEIATTEPMVMLLRNPTAPPSEHQIDIFKRHSLVLNSYVGARPRHPITRELLRPEHILKLNQLRPQIKIG